MSEGLKKYFMLSKSYSMLDMQALFGLSRSGMRKIIVRIEKDEELSPLLNKRKIEYYAGKDNLQKRTRYEYVIDEILVKAIANRSTKSGAIAIQDKINQQPNDKMVAFLVNQLQRQTRTIAQLSQEVESIKTGWTKIEGWGGELQDLLQSFHALKDSEMENPHIRHKWQTLHYAEKIEYIEKLRIEGDSYIFTLFKQASPALTYIRANSTVNEPQFLGKIVPKWGEIGRRYKENKSQPDTLGVVAAFGQSKAKHYTVIDECYDDYYQYVSRLRTIHCNRQMEYEPEKNPYANYN